MAVFSTFTSLCNHLHHPSPELLIFPNSNSVPVQQFPILLSSQPLATMPARTFNPTQPWLFIRKMDTIIITLDLGITGDTKWVIFTWLRPLGNPLEFFLGWCFWPTWGQLDLEDIWGTHAGPTYHGKRGQRCPTWQGTKWFLTFPHPYKAWLLV